MKLTKIFLLCGTLILFIPTIVEAQMNIQTDNTRVETDSGGTINISTDRTKVQISDDAILVELDDYYNGIEDENDNFYDPRIWSRYRYERTIPERYEITNSGTTCSQQNTQSTIISGSSRQINQSSVSNCK